MPPQQSQKSLWNKIAKQWHDFRTEKKSGHITEFLKGKSGKIIDLGAGSGRHLQKIKNTKMYLVDYSEEMIKLAKKHAKEKNIDAEFKIADMTKLPFKDNFFDYAIAASSFHCLKPNQHKKAAKELYRVLKNQGQAEISVWNKESKRFKNAPKEKLVGWQDLGKRYYYLFEKEEIYTLFKSVGFKIIFKEDPRRMIVFVVEK